jgi:hypothetical protein
MKSRLVTVTLALAAAGCSTIPTSTTPITMQSGKPVPAARIYQAERTVPSPGHTAKVSFLRDAGFLGGACTHKILVDGKTAFAIRAGEYQTLHLAPGQHSFALEIEGGVCPAFSTSHATLLSDGAEETYRIFIPPFISPSVGIAIAADHPRIEIVGATTGASRGSAAGLQGRIEHGRYSAPNEKVVFSAPNIGGPEHMVRDVYVAGIDRGFLEETNQFGLQGVYYTSLAGLGISPPSDTNEHRAALNKGWTNFAMPNIFTAASRKAEVVHQEFVADQGKEMLLAIVRLPELSGAFDVRTKRKFDAYPAVLLLVDGGYVVVLRSQFNLEDASRKDPKESVSDYLTGLRKRKAGLEFRQ